MRLQNQKNLTDNVCSVPNPKYPRPDIQQPFGEGDGFSHNEVTQ